MKVTGALVRTIYYEVFRHQQEKLLGKIGRF